MSPDFFPSSKLHLFLHSFSLILNLDDTLKNNVFKSTLSQFSHYVTQFYSHRESSSHLVSHLRLHSTHGAITEKAYLHISRILDYFICVSIRHFNWGILFGFLTSFLAP